MTPRFFFTALFSDLVATDAEHERVAGAYGAALRSLGGEPAPAGGRDAAGERPLCLFVATGGTERKALELLAARAASAPAEPALLVAHPTSNSLPAALEVLGKLRQDGGRGRIVPLTGPDDRDGLERLEAAVSGLAVRRALRAARVALVGPPSDWLVASSPAPDVVRRAWGPTVVELPTAEFGRLIASAPASAVAAELASLRERATACVEPDAGALEAAARVAAALHRLVADHGVDAVALRCFDLVADRRTTGCFALSALADSGVVAACEGDLVSAVAMLWARLLVGATPWMANPSQIDEAANALVLAHCTVPRGLVESVRLRSHFESGLGVAIQGELRRGPVTLVRIGGAAMEQLWLAEGEVVATGDDERLCRTQARVALSSGPVGDLLRAPLGNHLVMAAGHHADRLRDWWSWLR